MKQRVCAVQRSYICRAGADWGQSVICCLGPGDRLWYHQRAYSCPTARLRFYISSNSSSSPPTRTSHQVHSSVVSAFIFLFLMHCRKYARRSPLWAANDLFPSIFSTKGCANVVFMFTCCQSYRNKTAHQHQGCFLKCLRFVSTVGETSVEEWNGNLFVNMPPHVAARRLKPDKS